jgi:osmotically-inducible protein OsmY
MKLNRGFAAVVLAASLAGAVFAQRPSGHDDEEIFTAVQGALHDAPSLGSARITVRIREGYVTLGGVAGTVGEVATAGRLASRVPGVMGVINNIRIADRPMRS